MADSHSSLSVSDLHDIQAGPVAHVPTRYTTFLFFAVKNVGEFRKLFKEHVLPNITTTDDARKMRDEAIRAKSISRMADLAGINVSFSQRGLSKLLGDADTKDDAFKAGQFQRAQEILGDDTGKWLTQFNDINNPIDGLFEVAGYPETHVQEVVKNKIKDPLGNTAINVIYEHSGKARPNEQKGHEHFGFNDGISQPFVKFEDDDTQNPKREPFPGQTTVNPGVLVLGQDGDPESHPLWTKNGSFAVYRHLKQLVPEFRIFLEEVVRGSIVLNPHRPGLTDGDVFTKNVDYLGARLMGRWKSGMPVVLTDPKSPVDDEDLGKDPTRNNKFTYGVRGGTKSQLLCPFAAHTRKTGPRTDIPQAVEEERMIRRGGIPYGEELSPEETHETRQERGLSFVCYQSSVQVGFEFIQQSWANNSIFVTNITGFDPIIGQNKGQARKMTGYDTEDLFKELPIPMQFVIAQGGEYFFLPSITTLKEISNAA